MGKGGRIRPYTFHTQHGFETPAASQELQLQCTEHPQFPLISMELGEPSTSWEAAYRTGPQDSSGIIIVTTGREAYNKLLELCMCNFGKVNSY